MKLLSLIYGFIAMIRNKMYDLQILKSQKVDNVNIICIGNIVVGGSGKTPAVQYFAKELQKQGKKVGILSRGYKGVRKIEPLAVRDENEILVTVKESGDEAYLHSLHLKMPIVVSKDRYKGAKFLKEKFNVDTIIMDDGFQHRKLLKDKNIVLIDATNPFGGDEYLPKGRLRESVEELKRADEIIITKSNYVDKDSINMIKSKLEKYKKNIVISTFKESYFENVKKEIKPLSIVAYKKVLIFSSIANPQVFHNTVKNLLPLKIDEISFEDHHSYTKEEISNLVKKSKKYDYVLTTEKDIVKLNSEIENLLVLKMEFEIVEGKESIENETMEIPEIE